MVKLRSRTLLMASTGPLVVLCIPDTLDRLVAVFMTGIDESLVSILRATIDFRRETGVVYL